MDRKFTEFKLKTPGQGRDQIASQLGTGRGVFIKFYDRPGLPLDWEAPFIFYVNRVNVGFLDDDILKIDLEELKRTGSNHMVLENLSQIADKIIGEN